MVTNYKDMHVDIYANLKIIRVNRKITVLVRNRHGPL